MACREPASPDVREMRSTSTLCSESFVMPSFFGLDTGAVLRLRMSDDDAGMTNDLVRSLPLRRPGQPSVTLPTTTERVGRYGGMPERVS